METCLLAGLRKNAVDHQSELREASADRSAPEEVAELLLDETGQALPVAEKSRLGPKRLEVVADNLIQDARRRRPRLQIFPKVLARA